MDQPVYDRIGRTYRRHRRAEPSIVALIDRALAGARTVVDVGSGSGSYGPAGRAVVAVEPSTVMIAQRTAGAAPVVRAVAEALPFPAASFDAAVSVFSVHHWSDPRAGIDELKRVAATQIVLTWDAAVQAEAFWLMADYLPEVAELSAGSVDLGPVVELLSPTAIWPVPVPADCRDGFFGAYWKRPETYLDPSARASISAFALLDPGVVEGAMRRLATDLGSGSWHRRYEHLLGFDEIDLGYRLAIRRPTEAGPAASP